jgi:hypothetical protein
MRNRSEKDDSLWGEKAAESYAKAKHGPDGAVFLDPYLYGLLGEQQLMGARYLDLGAGAGPWTKHGLEKGVKSATALDINAAMLAKAKDALSIDGKLPERVSLIRADVSALVLSDNSFSRLVSINVGCNLPDGKFQKHFHEAFRVARDGARFVVTAPNSLLVPFTSTEEERDIQSELDELMGSVDAPDSMNIKDCIDQLRGILRATFIINKEGLPVLVTEENIELVEEGTPILRRIPGLVVDNNYHTGLAYIEAARNAGWNIVEAYTESFENEEARQEYNANVGEEERLGPEYVGNSSFLVLNLEKPR